MGRRKAAVFPDPVRAIATTSMPARIRGMVLRWIGVGTRYPLRLIPLKTLGLRLRDSKPQDFDFFLTCCLRFSSAMELTKGSLPIGVFLRSCLSVLCSKG